MNRYILSKENILLNTDSYRLLNFYLSPHHDKGDLKKGQSFSNPFLTRVQKTPSFNIYPADSGIWMYKDFATDDKGDVFSFIMKMKNCTFKEALEIINDDWQLGLGDSKVNQVESVVDHEDWDVENLKYWTQYGIMVETLKRFKVKPVKTYEPQKSNGERFKVYSKTEDPIFSYHIGNQCYKLYRPFSKRFKFSWIGMKPTNYVFGFKQLPGTGKSVILTGGEKDVLSLSARGLNAICLNSESALPQVELIDELNSRFKRVIVLYDIDKTGIEQSIKICNKYGLTRMVLPDVLREEQGKDVSDYFKNGHSLQDANIVSEKYEVSKFIKAGKYLPTILQTQHKLAKRKSEKISWSQPILTLDGEGVIYPRTINIIQGKAGVHKSRLAETMCSVFIKDPSCNEDLLGFKTDMLKRPTVCYVDTERNLSEQFPYALQQIQTKAGYTIADTPSNFDYISLLEIPRPDRFEALNEYLKHIRDKYSGHIVIILDVITDCIKDFNRSEDSMQLIDLMNVSINEHDVTFIALIHENPGSVDKARGHLGSELMNKSSVVIQVGFEKGQNGQRSDLIVMKFLKSRSTRRFEDTYLKYCKISKGLVLADSDMITEVIQSRQEKAPILEVIDFLKDFLSEGPVANRALIDHLESEFVCSSRLLRERLKEIIDSKIVIAIIEGSSKYLMKYREGREMFYKLSPMTK